jgi:glycosyltransferase involved in cell wall biosynthesis
MACGAPVVASRAGGLPEVVADGVTGYLLPVGAIDEMAEAGVRVLSDGALAKQLSEAARALTVERFSAEAIVPRYEALYDRVLSEG